MIERNEYLKKLISFKDKKLYEYIKSKFQTNNQNYIFPDEIQNVKDYQKATENIKNIINEIVLYI